MTLVIERAESVVKILDEDEGDACCVEWHLDAIPRELVKYTRRGMPFVVEAAKATDRDFLEAAAEHYAMRPK